MANTAESIAQQNAPIQQALKETSALAQEYSKISSKYADATGIRESGEVSQAHTALFLQTAKLLRTVRGPVDMIYSHFENSATTGATRALLEMGVFEKLQMDGKSCTASELSDSLGVDRVLLVRLMRVVTVTGLFQEVGVEEYAHTPYSLAYLVPELRGVFKLMIDEYSPAKIKLYEFFKENGWENPILPRNNPYTFAHKTNNQTMWEFLDDRPERAKVFNYAMAAQSRAINWTGGIFPFEAELRKYETDENTVLVVDVGGGKGHTSCQIRELCTDIKGRIILQDRPNVIADIAEDLPGVEKTEHDFFTPQPVKGALLYYIRHCLHDWPDEQCIKILTLLAGAMTPGGSRLLIAETVLPSMGADPEAGWMDLTMMTLTGTERTEKQFASLLDASGLKLDKAHTFPGTNHGVVEASLK